MYIQVAIEYNIDKRLKKIGYFLELFIIEIITHSFA